MEAEQEVFSFTRSIPESEFKNRRLSLKRYLVVGGLMWSKQKMWSLWNFEMLFEKWWENKMTDNRWNFPTCASSRFHFSYTRKVYSSSTKGRLSKNCWKKNENDKKTKRAFKKGRKNFLVMTCFLHCNLAFSSGLISLPRNQIIGWSTSRSIPTVAAAVPANENISLPRKTRCIISIQTSQWLMIWNCVQEMIIRAEKLKTAVNEFQSEFKWESATNLMQIVHINTFKLIQTFQIAWYLRFSMRYNEGMEKFKCHKLHSWKRLPTYYWFMTDRCKYWKLCPKQHHTEHK